MEEDGGNKEYRLPLFHPCIQLAPRQSVHSYCDQGWLTAADDRARRLSYLKQKSAM